MAKVTVIFQSLTDCESYIFCTTGIFATKLHVCIYTITSKKKYFLMDIVYRHLCMIAGTRQNDIWRVMIAEVKPR